MSSKSHLLQATCYTYPWSVHYPIFLTCLLLIYMNYIFRLLKPLLTDDTRGPWEIIWHHTLDKLDAFGLADRYWLFVYGR